MFLYVLVALLILVDVPYMLRAIWILLAHKLNIVPDLNVKNGQESVVNSICWTSDLDFMLHMNNSKYVRELDYGRYDYLERSGIVKLMMKNKFSFVQNAATIRFRRALELFHPFSIVTKVVYFDAKFMFFEQQIVSRRTGFIHAIAYNKNVILGCEDVEKFLM